MPHPDDLTTDRIAALLPVDTRGRPSIGGVSLLRKLGAGGDPGFAARTKGMAAYGAMVNPRQGERVVELRTMKG
ncbi:MAG: hypothetical protein HYY18_10730 [Planctomycetes bacterium]|nr:hypothetical protein [Planctomycetota bacterium]